MPFLEPDPGPPPPLRPGDFARILLATSGVPPRARARDQQADLTGEVVRQRILNRLVVLDPEPDDLEGSLLTIIAEHEPPAGPARGVCTAILQEWTMALMNPAYWTFLVREAIHAAGKSPDPSRRPGPSENEAAPD